MNLKDRLYHLARMSAKPENRMSGRSTLIGKAAQELAGVLVAATHAHATMLSRKFKGIAVRSIDTNLEGFSGPLFFDHFALECMFTRAAEKIEALEKEIEGLEKDNAEFALQALNDSITIKKLQTDVDGLKGHLSAYEANRG